MEIVGVEFSRSNRYTRHSMGTSPSFAVKVKEDALILSLAATKLR
jgi:hypothetical protein